MVTAVVIGAALKGSGNLERSVPFEFKDNVGTR